MLSVLFAVVIFLEMPIHEFVVNCHIVAAAAAVTNI
jgi:hypothetical protein